MIKSMTGYGTAAGTSGKLEITIELRSVNNRYLDCSIRMPRVYLFAEEALKGCVQAAVSRGKVDVSVSVDSSKSDDVAIKINRPLLEAYLEAFRGVSEDFGIPDDISTTSLLRMGDILSVEKQQADADEITGDFTGIINRALDGLNAMRIAEGSRLREDILGRLDVIEGLVVRVEERSPETVNEYRAKLEQRMREALSSVTIDDSRILTEAAIFADKVAVSEETVRLKSHIAQLKDMLESSEPIGRKIDFLLQEFNREANTIGSKCNDSLLAGVVIDLKAEIEKIREQAQNIE